MAIASVVTAPGSVQAQKASQSARPQLPLQDLKGIPLKLFIG